MERGDRGVPRSPARNRPNPGHHPPGGRNSARPRGRPVRAHRSGHVPEVRRRKPNRLVQGSRDVRGDTKAVEEGAAAVCCASTGNTSASAAAYAAKAGLAMHRPGAAGRDHAWASSRRRSSTAPRFSRSKANFDAALEVARELGGRLHPIALRELGEPVPDRGTENVCVRDRRQSRTCTRLPRHAGRQRREHHRAMEGIRRVRPGSSGDVRHSGRRRCAVRPR